MALLNELEVNTHIHDFVEIQQQIAFWFAADMLQLPVTNEEVVE